MISATLHVLSPGDHHALVEQHFCTETQLLHAIQAQLWAFRREGLADILVLHVCVEPVERPEAAPDRREPSAPATQRPLLSAPVGRPVWWRGLRPWRTPGKEPV